MLGALVSFFMGFFRSAVAFFQGVPGKVAILVTALSAIVAECRSFVDDIDPYFSSFFTNLDLVFAQFSRLVGDNSFFSLFSYCFAFDVLVSILANVVSFVAFVIGFLFVGFVHVVLIYFGLKFGYQIYKFLLGVASNGLAHS